MGFPKGASIPFGQGNPAREVASFILPDSGQRFSLRQLSERASRYGAYGLVAQEHFLGLSG